MPKIKQHQCHDCPSNILMCAHHRHEYCQGFFRKNATTMMARQVNKSWDGNFRFPRIHINGKSLTEFTNDELKQMQSYYHAVWMTYWEKTQKVAPVDRPMWPDNIKRAHERQIDIIIELERRHEHS